MEEKLTEQEMVELKHLAQITYEAILEGAKKIEAHKKAKATAKPAKKSK